MELTPYLIYGLYCPITDNLHYIGQSSRYLTRPLEHMSRSHSRKVREWVSDLKELGHAPKIKVLEYLINPDSLNDREVYWIQKSIADGCFLLNVLNNTAKDLPTARLELNTLYEDNSYRIIADYIKGKRKQVHLTQPELAQKAGVGLRFVRELEQGKKSTLRIDKINQVLKLFGMEVG